VSPVLIATYCDARHPESGIQRRGQFVGVHRCIDPSRQKTPLRMTMVLHTFDYAYLPLKTGARFSRNAFVPSVLSSVEQATANRTASR